MKINRRYTNLLVAFAFAGLMASPLFGDEPTDAKLLAEAKITKAEASKTALEKVPGGKISAAELEKEHGKLIWSFDIATPQSKNITEVQVDARTGKIADVHEETPKDQANEAAADKKAQ